MGIFIINYDVLFTLGQTQFSCMDYTRQSMLVLDHDPHTIPRSSINASNSDVSSCRSGPLLFFVTVAGVEGKESQKLLE